MDKKKILLIEDDRTLAELYKIKLGEEKFEVLTAIDVGEGLTLAKKEKPDLIILDILLPGRNGLSFLKKIRLDKRLSKIPVLAFSNYIAEETIKEALKLGAVDYLIKTDWSPTEFIKKIKKYIGDKKKSKNSSLR